MKYFPRSFQDYELRESDYVTDIDPYIPPSGNQTSNTAGTPDEDMLQKLAAFHKHRGAEQINEQLNERRRNNVVLYGIPTPAGIINENYDNLLQQIEKAFNYSLKSEVFACYRLPVKPDHLMAVPILIRFFDPSYKVAFIQRVKNSQVSAATFGGSPHVKIFANEHLTKTMSLVYREALRMRQLVNFKFVWTRNGYVYVKKDDTVPAVQIRSLEQLFRVFACTPSSIIKGMLKKFVH